MSKLVWTKERPKKEGYYWKRTTPGVEEILWIDPKFLGRYQTKNIEWAGPIPQPFERKTKKQYEKALEKSVMRFGPNKENDRVLHRNKNGVGKSCVCISDVHLGDFVEKSLRDRQSRRLRGMP